MNYHFGSKEKLLGEVIQRRWDEVAEARRAAYAEAMAKAGGMPTLEAVVASIITPYLERAMLGGKGWRSYALLQARVLYSEKTYTASLKALSEPLAREFLGWLRKAMPHAQATDLGFGYQFMIGCMVESCAEIGVNRIRRITDGACDATDFDQVNDRLVRFIGGGIRNLIRD